MQITTNQLKALNTICTIISQLFVQVKVACNKKHMYTFNESHKQVLNSFTQKEIDHERYGL